MPKPSEIVQAKKAITADELPGEFYFDRSRHYTEALESLYFVAKGAAEILWELGKEDDVRLTGLSQSLSDACDAIDEAAGRLSKFKRAAHRFIDKSACTSEQKNTLRVAVKRGQSLAEAWRGRSATA